MSSWSPRWWRTLHTHKTFLLSLFPPSLSLFFSFIFLSLFFYLLSHYLLLSFSLNFASLRFYMFFNHSVIPSDGTTPYTFTTTLVSKLFLRSYAYWESHTSTHASLHLNHVIGMTLAITRAPPVICNAKTPSPIQVHPMNLIRYLTNSAVQLPCQSVYGHTHTPMPLSV